MRNIDNIINESIRKILKEYEFDNERHEREWNFIMDYRQRLGDEYFSKKMFDFINFKGNLSEFIKFLQLRP